MEQGHSPRKQPDAPAQPAVLSVVRAPLQLARPTEPAPPAWDEELARLLEWLGIAADLAPAGPMDGVPVFAPWLGWRPSAFQLGGAPGLPQASFAASYCLEHARAAAPGQGGTDVVLMSPHPATCAPLPQPGVLAAMLRAARGEGRERIAVLGHARHRAELAAMLHDAGEQGAEALAIEDSLVPLASGCPPWDAVIAMPEWRSTIFTLLARASGVRGAWPMLWHGETGLVAITAEVAGEGDCQTLALDAPALVHALALGLDAAGAARAAWRLHDAWARLRDSGVTTAGRGAGDAPYATLLSDSDFLDRLCKDMGSSKRKQAEWLALKSEKSAILGSQKPAMRVVS